MWNGKCKDWEAAVQEHRAEEVLEGSRHRGLHAVPDPRDVLVHGGVQIRVPHTVEHHRGARSEKGLHSAEVRRELRRGVRPVDKDEVVPGALSQADVDRQSNARPQ